MIAGYELEVSIIVILFTALAFWKKNPYLYLIAGPVVLAYSFSIYDMFSSPTGMALTLSVAGVGAYCLVCCVMRLTGRWK